MHRLACLNFPCMTSRAYYFERANEFFVDNHNGASVVKLSTVVGSRENSNQLSITLKFVTIFHYLVGTAYEVKIMLFQEPLDNVVTKSV